MTKIKLYNPLDYQFKLHKRLCNNNYSGLKYTTVVSGRQNGKSTCMLSQSVYWALSSKSKIFYITLTYKLSKNFYKKIIDRLPPEVIKSSNSSDLIIEFQNGSILQFLSCESGDSLRGLNCEYMIIDEAAFVNEDFFNYVLKQFLIVTGKQLVLVSTPNGKKGFFFNYYLKGLNSQNNDKYKTFIWKSTDSPLISKDEMEEAKKSLPDNIFKQEYLCEFLDNATGVFKNIEECIIKSPQHTTEYYAGIDVGRNEDYTVLTILNENREVCDILRINMDDWDNIANKIVEKLNTYNIKKCLVEINGVGDVFYDLLEKKLSNKNILLEFLTTNESKRMIIENLIVNFQNKEIGIPNNDELILELGNFRQFFTRTKKITYEAAAGLHDDCVMSLAMANYAYNTYHSIKLESTNVIRQREHHINKKSIYSRL